MVEKKPNVNLSPAKTEENKLIHDLKPAKTTSGFNPKLMVITLLVIAAGVLTGYLLRQKGGIAVFNTGGTPKTINSGKIVGSTDTKSFKDSAEGTLEKGGIDGEGTHKLIRPGGVSQTVYLTSSVVNLDDYVGKKVKIWGETFAAQKAGWLMDVGRVQKLE